MRYDWGIPVELVGHTAIRSFQGRRGSDATRGEQYTQWLGSQTLESDRIKFKFCCCHVLAIIQQSI